MSRQKVLYPMIHLALVALFLVGCGAPADTPTAAVSPVTDTPVIASTDIAEEPPATVTPVPEPTATAVPEPSVVASVEPGEAGCDANSPPIADAGGPYQAMMGKGHAFVTLDGSQSSDADGTIETYEWDFGDNSEPGSGQSIMHPYGSIGSFEAKLTVTDNCGATGQDTAEVTIVGPTPPPTEPPVTSTPVPTTDTPEPPTPVTPTDTPEPPMPTPFAMLMDGKNEYIVYNPDPAIPDKTNADDIANILKDLPIDTCKETTSVEWQWENRVCLQDPELIIIHGSAFYPSDDYAGKFESFICDRAQDTQAKFVIYTRRDCLVDGYEDCEQAEEVAKQAYENHDCENTFPLKGRVEVLYAPFPEAQDDCRYWECSGPQERLRGKVKSLLELP